MKKNPPEPARVVRARPISDNRPAYRAGLSRSSTPERQRATRHRLYANQNVYTSQLLYRLPDLIAHLVADSNALQVL
jgi:hypothetical protein